MDHSIDTKHMLPISHHNVALCGERGRERARAHILEILLRFGEVFDPLASIKEYTSVKMRIIHCRRQHYSE